MTTTPKVLSNYLKALVVLTKPCSDLVAKLVKEQTTKDTQIDEDREMWQKDLKRAIKENRMMEREERYEKRRLELVERDKIIKSRREAKRKLTEERREKKKAELKKKKEREEEKRKGEGKGKNKKLLAKLKAQNAKAAEGSERGSKEESQISSKGIEKAAVTERTLTASLPSVKIIQIM